MTKTVLVPLDLGREADRALPVGAALASQIGAALDVVCVSSPGLDPATDEAAVRTHVRAAGVDIDGVRVRYDDDVVAGVLAEAATTDGILCCATHARGLVAELFFHSVSGRLLRSSRSPLVLVGPDVPMTPLRFVELLVCVDGPCPDQVVAATATWARLLGAPVHVFQVIDPSLPQPYPTAERLADALQGCDIDATWEMCRHVHPAQAILDRADRMKGPLVVMGANDQRPDQPANLGPVSLSVVHRSTHPVLVVPASPGGS